MPVQRLPTKLGAKPEDKKGPFVLTDGMGTIWYGPFKNIESAEHELKKREQFCACGCKRKVSYLVIEQL